MADRPNVLWIMADQHNAKVTGWDDHPETVHTPNLERLCDRGVRFDCAFAQNPLCTPSRTSFLTGQYPQNHGYYGLPQFTTHIDEAPSDPATVFDTFEALGYRTGAIGKIHAPDGLLDNVDYERNVLERAYGRHHNGPYEEYLHRKGILEDRDDQLLQEGGFDGRPSRLAYQDTSEYWSVEQAKQFIREDEIAYPGVEEYVRGRPGYKSHADEPFFLWLSFMRPHNPYTPPREFWDMYPDPEDVELPPSVDEDLSDKPELLQRVRELQESGEMFPPAVEPKTYEEQLRRVVTGYLGCVSMIDDLVGRMLDFLEAEGILKDTIVIYCSDHGEFVAEHGLMEKAPGVSYDAVSRVPMIWSWPERFREGAVSEELVESVDLPPTLVSAVADEPFDAADGIDLADHLAGDESSIPREYAVTETPWVKSVRTRDRRLTVYPRGYFGEGSEEYVELYDLEEDPWETENLGGPGADDEEIRELKRYTYEFAVTERRPYTVMPSDPGRNVSNVPNPRNPKDVPRDGTIPPAWIRTFLAKNGGSLHL